MKRFFIYVFLIVSISKIEGQVAYYQSLREELASGIINGFDLYIDDSSYVIEHYSVFCGIIDDHSSSIVMTYGICSQQADTLFMKDYLNGYEMIAVGNGRALVFQEAPFSIKGMEFNFNCYLEKMPYWDNPYVNEALKSVIDCRELYQIRIDTNELKLGYYSVALWGGYWLELLGDNRFNYYYDWKNYLISKGIWSRKGNLLILQDEDVNKPFYALINDDNTLVSCFLPDALFGEKLYYKEYVDSYQMNKDSALLDNNYINEQIGQDPATTPIITQKMYMEEYSYVKSLYKKGNIEKNIGWGLFATAPAVIIVGWFVHPGHEYWQFKAIAGLCFASSCVLIPVGYVHKAKGLRKMNFIVEHYGIACVSNSFSVRLTPSLMQCDMPQTCDNLTMGLTLSIDF